MAYKNKEDQKVSSDSWYQRNKEKHKINTAKHKKENRLKWSKYKASLSCTQCGVSHPALIDFHHVIRDNTKRSVNRLVGEGRFTAAMEEIKKCIPLCANCHRLLHWNEALEKKIARKRKKNIPPGAK